MAKYPRRINELSSKLIPALAYSIALIAILQLAWTTWTRVIFPWDLLVWAESPFLTNMLKIHQGVPIYSDPALANSFVYAPGLEYLTYIVLRPFNLHLDIRWCRAVTVLIGLGAAFAAGYTTYRVAWRISNQRMNAFPFMFLATSVCALVLFSNFAADVPHPDNLHILHAVLVLMTCVMSIQTERFGLAIACVVFAGLGVFAKQTAAIAFLGPVSAFAIINCWGWRRTLTLLVLGGATVAVSLLALWLHPYGKFYTFDLPSSHAIRFNHITYFADLVIKSPTFILGVLGVTHLWRFQPEGRKYLICWFCTGLFTAAPNLAPFLKAMGSINNLVIMYLWMVIGAWPFLGRLPRLPQNETDTAAWSGRILGCLANLAVIGYFVTLFPDKAAPTPPDYEYCQRIQDSISADTAAGRKVLVTHGTMFQLHAGNFNIPLDRSNSVLELWQGQQGHRIDSHERLRDHHYDRIYMIADDFYDDDVRESIDKYYEEIDAFPASPHQPGAKSHAGVRTGMQVFMIRCPVLAPKAGIPTN